jgi:hypothetical protein
MHRVGQNTKDFARMFQQIARILRLAGSMAHSFRTRNFPGKKHCGAGISAGRRTT